ncbi:MAG TPA: dTMP kinase [Clostridia bacterium]|jgi:dTMP kinase|nr:MAG: Thymidylate kinase [Firmicutes bacterium ADurb.Bin099]HNZ40508.1 dTMP kinase [Clostridia bacterium]HPY98121.1 dTMP kinase [Clostridia bacterium]HQC68062.1 dTMP kinase [Clostridia bacterium]
MAKGMIISFEGTDGSGKTTQIKALSRYLEEKGYMPAILREPGGTRIGEEIRSILLNSDNTEMASLTEMLLYASSRAQMMEEKVEPLLKEGKIVILDRFFDSSLAYQAYGRDLNFDAVLSINLAAVKNIVPKITFFIDITPEQSLKRRQNATATDRLENEDMSFHYKVYEGYKKLLERFPERIIRIDGTKEAREITNEITSYVDNVLKEDIR